MKRKVNINDTVKLKKDTLDIGLPVPPLRGAIGKVISKKGVYCKIEFERCNKYPSGDGSWTIRSHDLEVICECCHKAFCYALREEKR